MDALRALAALLVVWTHVTEAFVTFSPRGAWLAEVAHYADFGRAGVVTFFAISGYVIPWSLKGERSAGARAFLIRRFFRLYPAYWLSVPLGAITSWWMWGKPVTAALFLANLTMVQEALGFASFQGLYWTLQIELVFYAACLVLFWFGRLRSASTLRALIAGLALVFPVAVTHGWPDTAFLCLHLSIMFWGALWRHWLEGERLARWDQWLLWSVVPAWLAAAGVLAVARPELRFPVAYALGLGLFALGTTVMPVRVRAMAWLGEISYSLYLFHPVVFYTMLWLLQAVGWPWLREVHLGMYLVAAGVLSVGLAAGVFYGVERPAMALGKRWSGKGA